jgi:hypothetical protein
MFLSVVGFQVGKKLMLLRLPELVGLVLLRIADLLIAMVGVRAANVLISHFGLVCSIVVGKISTGSMEVVADFKHIMTRAQSVVITSMILSSENVMELRRVVVLN